MVERSDISRYDNDKYTGLLSREVRSSIRNIQAPKSTPSFAQNDSWYSGSFFVLEQTKSNQQNTSKGIDSNIDSTFRINANGEMVVVKDNGFPTFRSFPCYPNKPVKPGDTWVGEGKRAVDPLNKGIYTRLPILVQYTFVGNEIYKGDEVYRIKAKWATRYGNQYMDYSGDKDLIKASGTHDADIRVLKDTGEAILIRDKLDEYFVYSNGQKVAFRGTSLMFTEYYPAINKEQLIASVKQIQDKEAKINNSENTKNNDIKSNTKSNNSDWKNSITEDIEQTTNSQSNLEIEETEKGLRLSIRDIRFKPNSSEILDDQLWRLDEIAKVLKQTQNHRFLVEGHTASVGNPEGEKQLSIERAKQIIKLLVQRGLEEGKFVFSGYGGTKPIADNSTAEGKALNRRVEITILE